MRGVVVDSSAAVAWLLPDEPLRDQAIAMRNEMASGDLDPVVAAHFRFEVSSALMQAARRGRIPWESVIPMLAATDAFALRSVPLSPDDEALLHVCRAHGLSWADAHHVLVARALDLPLVTADRKLARAVPGTVAWVHYLGDRRAD